MQDSSHSAEKIKRVEERASIVRHRVAGARVQVRLIGEDHATTVGADLAGEEVEVSRIAVGRLVDAVPDIRIEGDVTIIPVVEETLIVQTRLLLKEEIHVRRRATQEHVELPVTLRRHRAEIECSEHGDRTPPLPHAGYPPKPIV